MSRRWAPSSSKDGTVRWHPPVDFGRIFLGRQVVVIVALLTIRAIVKHRP